MGLFSRTAALACCLAGTAAAAQGGVLLFPAVASQRQVTVYGRTLGKEPATSRSRLKANLKRLTAANAEGVEVEVRCEGQAAKTKSAHDGNFEATFAARDGGFAPGVLTVEALTASGVRETATVEIVSDAAPFVVISDFDDTVAVTNVLDKKGLVQAALLQDETTQPVVPGMAPFYGCLREARPQAPGFALVSGSPVQYAPRIKSFLSRHRFPLFGLYLRDLGPQTLEGYKQPVIRRLLKQLHHPVVLIGDSGEHDPEVYEQIRGEFPGRVRAIYIRDAGNSASAARFKDMVLFKDPKDAARDAAARGLFEKACVDRAFAAPPQGASK